MILHKIFHQLDQNEDHKKRDLIKGVIMVYV
jgi:hypothetical protein